MKKRLYIVCALLTALCVGCSKDEAAAGADGTGVLEMRISATRTETATGYDPAEHLTVRIYNAAGELLRKYTAQEELPADNRLELLAGDYRVAVELGEAVAASTSVCHYKGEETFTITPGGVTTAEVTCRLQNTVAEVKFDPTIAENFGENFYAWTVIAEQVDEELAAAGAVPALRFTADGKGYFTLPEGATTLAWKFAGEHLSRGSVVQEGTQAVVAGGKYVLTFRYSKDLPGYIECFTVKVDPSTDDQDDTIIFSPDPTLEGEGFDIGAVQDFIPGKTAERSYKIVTMSPLQSAELTVGEEHYDLLALAARAAADGIVVERTGEKSLRVTLTDPFFAARAGGSQTLAFRITDTAGGLLEKSSEYRVQGLLPVTAADYDLWNNSVTLRALVLDPEAGAVRLALREADGTWQEAEAVAGADNLYTTQFTAAWEQTQNEAGLSVSTPVEGTGVFAGRTYEYRAEIGGVQTAATFATPAGDTIYNAGMELWSTYNVIGGSFTKGEVPYPNESSSVEFWVGGNNKQTNTLCTGSDQIAGSNGKCAVLKPMTAFSVFAAGNLFTGTFDCGTGAFDTYGFARFGVKYAYSARPKALSVHVKATVTTVTNTGGPLQKGDIDPARIYVCVIDWGSRHAVKSGASSDPNTFWDPATSTSLAEGPILAYGSLTITESFDWSTLTLPLNWYDREGAPAEGNYSLVISCVSSAYGDYVAGSVNNQLCVEDFEWVY